MIKKYFCAGFTASALCAILIFSGCGVASDENVPVNIDPIELSGEVSTDELNAAVKSGAPLILNNVTLGAGRNKTANITQNRGAVLTGSLKIKSNEDIVLVLQSGSLSPVDGASIVPKSDEGTGTGADTLIMAEDIYVKDIISGFSPNAVMDIVKTKPNGTIAPEDWTNNSAVISGNYSIVSEDEVSESALNAQAFDAKNLYIIGGVIVKENFSAATLNVYGTLNVEKPLNCDVNCSELVTSITGQAVSAKPIVVFDNAVFTGAHTIISQPLTVEGSFTYSGGVDFTSHNTVTVEGGASFSGNVMLEGISTFNSNFSVAGGLLACTADIRVKGTNKILGGANFSGPVIFDGDTTLSGNLIFTNTANFNGDTVLFSKMTSGSSSVPSTFSGITHFKKVTLNGAN
ncbi:MAG: hypothetical protein LBV52_05880, partial [Spirochaetaceae bacterium]|nr:hypothetical protein [Spirochaetaceae bacterium]